VSAGSERAVDRAQLRALLGAYLRLSLRARGMTFGSAGAQRGARGFWMVGFGYAMAGAAMSVLAVDHPDVFTFAVMIHTGTLLMALSVTGVIAGDVLFSPAEPEVLGFRPVSPATLLLAKSLNLAGVAAAVALIFNLAPTFMGLAASGARPWFPLVHLLSTVLLALFAAAAQVFLYALLARLVERERLERVAALTQIALSVGLILVWQLVPRLAERASGLRLERFFARLAPLPAAWFAAFDAALGGAQREPRMLALAAAGCAITGVLGWTAVRRLAPGLGEAMAAVRVARVRPARPAALRTHRGRDLAALLGPWLRDPVERGAFRLTATYLRRDREVMTRLFPGFGPVLAIMIIAALQQGTMSEFYLGMAAVMFALESPTALGILQLSSQHAAAEVFAMAPLRDPAAVFHGVRKAVFVCLMLPMGAVLGLACLLVFRERALALAGTLPVLALVPVIELLPAAREGYLPLSRDPQRGLQSGRTTGTLLLSFLILLPASVAGPLAQRFHLLPALLAAEVAGVLVVRTFLLRRVRASGRILPAD
jgi:hypothetical protein